MVLKQRWDASTTFYAHQALTKMVMGRGFFTASTFDMRSTHRQDAHSPE